VALGVIGTGNIGQDHIRRITQASSGASVVAVTDIDAARAQKIAKGLGGRAETTGQNLIAAKDVDAVIVTSIGSTHEEFVLGRSRRANRYSAKSPWLLPQPPANASLTRERIEKQPLAK
jgi:predicted dehydrogenase